MPNIEDKEINYCIRNLDSEDQSKRIEAMNILADIGDELCLKELREKLKCISQKHQA